MSNDFATKLISLRSERNLTQQQLADSVGITPSQISRYESGQAKPRKTVLLKLAAVLGIDLSELAPEEHLRVVIGERLPIDPPTKLRERMLAELASMDTEEARQTRSEAEKAGVPYEDYISNKAEEKFIEIVKEATKSGDTETAALYIMFSRLLFGTNVKVVDDSKNNPNLR